VQELCTLCCNPCIVRMHTTQHVGGGLHNDVDDVYHSSKYYSECVA